MPNVRTHYKLQTSLYGLVVDEYVSLESLRIDVDDFGIFDVDHGEPDLSDFGYLGVVTIIGLN